MSLADYATRRYDYLAFQGVSALGNPNLEMELYSAATGGAICTGVQKLAQRWALEFLTEAGSMPGLPLRGCPFMTQVRHGTLLTSANVFTAFAASDLYITRNLRNEETDDMPADERFASAKLTSVSILPGYVSLHVMITSRAGESRSVILPVETLP